MKRVLLALLWLLAHLYRIAFYAIAWTMLILAILAIGR